MTETSVADELMDVKPVVFVLSDAQGKTAVGVVEAAADQFVDDAIVIKRLGNVKSVEMVCDYLDAHADEETPMAVFHTIADRNLRRDVRRELDNRAIPSIDLLGPAVQVIANLTGDEPASVSGQRTDVSVMEL